MHVAECAIQSERLSGCLVCLLCFSGKRRDCVRGCLQCTVCHAFRSVYVRRLWIKKKKNTQQNLTCFTKSDFNLQPLLVLLQDAQLCPSVVTASVLIS